ncbi:HAD family hydrolase [Aurantibacter crassamenti]|uniref:HAD family hydrolase n=1 Tax=Aurantibacter crassamenti TaxID=1837375 RepID=UPI001939F3C3|nr:HAD family hydrolase [Aurantibacter crassamenti]MBM1108160.1 HAD family hydrolase [Aurantibacter crassamenti]
MNKILNAVDSSADCTTVFCDLYDTLLHRTVHPHYVIKLWSKAMVRELGLEIEIDNLFFIRRASIEHLCEKLEKKASEIPYRIQIKEIYQRLMNQDLIKHWSFDEFLAYSSAADIRSEFDVQFVNTKVKTQLYKLKEKGYKLYCVSDFYLSKAHIVELLKLHGIGDLFNDVFVSSTREASKENKGSLYLNVLSELNLEAKQVIMFGDNKRSDCINASKHGIQAVRIANRQRKLSSKFKLFGSDQNNYESVNRELEERSSSSSFAYSEYIILFHTFMERLYKESKKKQIKNLFFISREGYFLKRLFDYYQSTVQLNTEDHINAHYFKASRASTMQVAHKELDLEYFEHLQRKDADISVENFLKSLLFEDKLISEIANEVDYDQSIMIQDFYNSEVFRKIKINEKFKNYYEESRISQKEAFRSYIDTYNIDFEKEGMAVVDVGWRGTMQECIHTFFEEKVDVQGYYLGLKEGYKITESTKRYGLNFSVYPTSSPSDNVLMANRQLYEQLLAAPHGSTIGYRDKPGDYSIERYEKREREVYFEHIAPLQEFMFSEFCQLIDDLKPICYEQDVVQKYMTDLALRLGLFADRKKIKFMHEISKGFYQNVGNNEVGVSYEHSQLRESKLGLIKRFLFFPEKTFRFLVKIKPMLYSKGLYRMSYPVNLIYYYIKFVNRVKGLVFKKKLLEY